MKKIKNPSGPGSLFVDPNTSIHERRADRRADALFVEDIRAEAERQRRRERKARVRAQREERRAAAARHREVRG